MADSQQLDQFVAGKGFVAALDQSGGSSPKALRMYGIEESEYSTDEQMYDLIHQERVRIITNPKFTSERILAAILFEDTLNREIEGLGSAEYLWKEKGIIPFLKIDKGLEAEANSAQLMKPIPGLEDTLARAKQAGAFGTKERSVIKDADEVGVENVVKQQFDVAAKVLAAGLIPILEPEVNIHANEKAEAERLLKQSIFHNLDTLGGGQQIAVKITIPSEDDFYSDLIADERVLRVVALSGGYSRDEANEKLSHNPGLTASFSRALLDGLTAQQSEEEFTNTLDASIESIYRASNA